jgi:lipopolysaccharide/colanic/teichoic acid biosynthesis glycosyltransferase
VKRGLDICAGALGLVVLAIVTIPIAPLILLEDGGPVFYRAQRRGRYGRAYTMVKFRSMHVGASPVRNPDGSLFVGPSDARLTRVGTWLRKTSLDEVPQVLNILVGDMSLVGPRPHLALRSWGELSVDEQEALRVRPGLTGYNQAYWRNLVPTDVKTRNDVHYVRNLSFSGDMAILWQTVKQVVRRSGVYADPGAGGGS